jgi:hypothetical protein
MTGNWNGIETAIESKARREKEDAFWNRPSQDVIGDLAWNPHYKRLDGFEARNVIVLSQWKRKKL